MYFYKTLLYLNTWMIIFLSLPKDDERYLACALWIIINVIYYHYETYRAYWIYYCPIIASILAIFPGIPPIDLSPVENQNSKLWNEAMVANIELIRAASNNPKKKENAIRVITIDCINRLVEQQNY